MIKVNNKNTRRRGEVCSKLIIETTERRPSVFIVNFEHVSHLFPNASIIDFEQVNVSWGERKTDSFTVMFLSHEMENMR